MIVPEIARTGRMIAAQLPGQLEQFFAWAQSWLASLQIPVDVFQNINIDWNKVVNIVTDSIKNGGSAVFNTTVGDYFVHCRRCDEPGTGYSILHLSVAAERTVGDAAEKCNVSFLPSYRVEKLLSVGQLSNRIFFKFVSGQCTEAVILGLLCFIGMSIFSMPYAMMISVVIGVTALIPMFGAFIGAGIGARF